MTEQKKYELRPCPFCNGTELKINAVEEQEGLKMLNYIFYIYNRTQLVMTFEVAYMYRAIETLMPYLEKVGDDKAKEYIAWTVITTAQMNPGREIALNPAGSYKLIVEIKER